MSHPVCRELCSNSASLRGFRRHEGAGSQSLATELKGFVGSFATMMTTLLGIGLIFLDPLDADLKKLAAPIYSARRDGHRTLL